MKNRLKYFRHKLEIDSKREFAKMLEASYRAYIRWEAQEAQPDLPSAWKVYKNLKKRIPGLHFEDMFEE